ncbi:unnamed protein product [Darwinula stevensoni]|uniref:Chitin-binding type-2 domain-containing protein n=1 Tax=Darwinula stevensoni TaxID=69355 RepID=A0A7R9A7M1_9CRUS|nr:unnamed protein product [Darwinula stevensoni]CAG0892514.1 unnamed protein product [Darwinula stevensoni]
MRRCNNVFLIPLRFVTEKIGEDSYSSKKADPKDLYIPSRNGHGHTVPKLCIAFERLKMRFAVVIASLLTFALAANAGTIHKDLVKAGLLQEKIWRCQCGCECLDDECHEPDCGEGTYFPHPEDCGSFCQCSNGKAYYHACPDGLMFNPALNVCDWPENVCCNAPVNPHICADHGCH